MNTRQERLRYACQLSTPHRQIKAIGRNENRLPDITPILVSTLPPLPGGPLGTTPPNSVFTNSSTPEATCIFAVLAIQATVSRYRLLDERWSSRFPGPGSPVCCCAKAERRESSKRSWAIEMSISSDGGSNSASIPGLLLFVP